jgi:serine/threonine-protein kinase RsbW
LKNYNFKIQKQLLSERVSISEVEPLISRMRELSYFDDKVYHNILVTLTEAVNNALIHGNKLSLQKKVNISLYCDDKLLECVIEDEGEGFDLNKIPDPRSPENLLKDNGRGVFIINSLAKKVDYISGENGTKVCIIFDLI